MANIWRKDDNYREKPSRNVMDLSFQNNLTFQFGKLVPVLCQETIPGDSFSIDPTFALKFQPLVFPIQTRMKAYLHIFKVRNRNLWKDWEDFIAKNKDNLISPYLDTSITKPTTGSLLDYLGVPTTINETDNFGSWDEFPLTPSFTTDGGLPLPFYFSKDRFNPASDVYDSDNVVRGEYTTPLAYVGSEPFDTSDFSWSFLTESSLNALAQEIPEAAEGAVLAYKVELTKKDVLSVRIPFVWSESLGIDVNTWLQSPVLNAADVSSSNLYFADGSKVSNEYYTPLNMFAVIAFDEAGNFLAYTRNIQISNQGELQADFGQVISSVKNLYVLTNSNYLTFTWLPQSYPSKVEHEYEVLYSNESGAPVLRFRPSKVYVKSKADSSVSTGNVVDIDEDNSPYWRGGTTDLRERIKLSALPCRAYEAIYNSFYRNAENNPYVLNGVPEYNKYIPSDEGGVDTNLYEIRSRNWEDDFLTTALPMPQAGIAPLVGLTGTAGTATVTMQNEDGEVVEANANYDEEGNVTAITTQSTSDFAKSLVETVTYGISIQDLRNVNSFQRWLEAKARGGYKYRDQIETLFGVTVRYDTLDMPEFIGGMSLDVMVNQISQTVPTETSPLGDYAGQASCVGSGQRITEYFDEHGYIIGILSVVPVPNYSQLLPKHFIKHDAFDYFFPQFGHIGMQPINYDEVCPIQAYQESTESDNVLEDVFGYQRAWYDYLARTDEVHGEFRTSLRNFVMNRTFDVKPELSESFLLVDPEQLNDVFAIQDNEYHKILGQVYFNIKAKRPIPLYGIPKLE